MQDSLYSREEYATKQFWDNRYKEKQCYFDWYAEFPQLKQTLQIQYGILHQHRILMLGCGNSKISDQMYEQGYHNIVNIDISQTVIQQMKRNSQSKGYIKMEWIAMDATDMKDFPNNSFDVIIDKGTLDALISGNNIEISKRMLRQAVRVLKKQGQLIIVTYGSPEGRRRFFETSIGLTRFDYYFTRVDLSSMSTLINLMRSNLGNQPLRQITKDSQTMKKTMMQYTLIKALRKNRKNQKKLIVWSEVKKQQEVQLGKNQSKNIGKPVLNNELDRKQDKVEGTGTGQNQIVNKVEQKKITYNPKKQTFCLVYSIRLKFAIDLEEVVQGCETKPPHQAHSLLQGPFVAGDQNLNHVSIYAPGCQKQLQKALIYLRAEKLPYNPLTLYESEQLFDQQGKSIKIKLKQGSENVIPILSKTLYQITINTKGKNTSLACFDKAMTAISEILIEKGGLSAHPTPKNYSFLGYVLQKHEPKTPFHQLLKKYWYPTYRLKQHCCDHFIYQLSVPPSLPQSFCLQQIANKLSGYPQETQKTCQGYLNFFDPRVINLANFCSVNYCGTNIKQSLIIQQFSSRPQSGKELQAAIYFQRKFMPHLFARLLSAL